MFETIEKKSDGFFEVFLESTKNEPPEAYDDFSGDPIEIRIKLIRDDHSGFASSTEELLHLISELGVPVGDYSRKEPTMLAVMTSYLENHSRVVMRTPFFETYENQLGIQLDSVLPRYEPPFLIWHTLAPLGEESPIIERKMLIET